MTTNNNYYKTSKYLTIIKIKKAETSAHLSNIINKTVDTISPTINEVHFLKPRKLTITYNNKIPTKNEEIVTYINKYLIDIIIKIKTAKLCALIDNNIITIESSQKIMESNEAENIKKIFNIEYYIDIPINIIIPDKKIRIAQKTILIEYSKGKIKFNSKNNLIILHDGAVKLKYPFEESDLEINKITKKYLDNKREEILNTFKETYENIKNTINFKLGKKLENKMLTETKINQYMFLDPITWDNGKRENQQIWPTISTKKEKHSIEFPNNSGIYYTSQLNDKKYVGLRLRSDDNINQIIPLIYKKDPRTNKNSITNKYYNNELLQIEATKIISNIKPKFENEKLNINITNDMLIQIIDFEKTIKGYYSKNQKTWIKIEKNIDMIINNPNIITWTINSWAILKDLYIKDLIKETDNLSKCKNFTDIGIIDNNFNETIYIPKNVVNLKLMEIEKQGNSETFRILNVKIKKTLSYYNE